MKSPIRTNNFDLIRLLAAAQVVAHHGIDHLGLDRHSGIVGVLATAIRYLPGVPVFFFVSGFLISKSYESSPSVLEYARNRVLRIYPALIVCTVLSVMAVFALGYLPRPDAPPPRLALWMLAQMSIVQFYNPDFMRAFGVGVLNGSLWTITVELQFYLVTPLLYAVLGLKHRRGTLSLALLALALLVPNLGYWHADPENHPGALLKLFGVTFLPWYTMFLVGVLAQRNFHQLHRLLAGRALLAGAIYLGATHVAVQMLGWGASNDIHPVLYLLLAAFVFSLAYTWPGTAEKLLHRQDISYGVYIYHMPCINVLLYLGMKGHAYALGITYIAVALMATLSWVWVERPCLSMKRGGLRHGSAEAEPLPPPSDDLPATAPLPTTGE
ncbi:acyltransferase family protein [Dyella amyloliquefaciens]|uniref:acyltransferase family protein n=1 Tax=Dyella amyloliquefaciens TaxID=1770545 RepID=UPI00102EC593|nr:acyltransferase [Dyella amyloliquefaciens]